MKLTNIPLRLRIEGGTGKTEQFLKQMKIREDGGKKLPIIVSVIFRYGDATQLNMSGRRFLHVKKSDSRDQAQRGDLPHPDTGK
jgi:hypothetical protein